MTTDHGRAEGRDQREHGPDREGDGLERRTVLKSVGVAGGIGLASGIGTGAVDSTQWSPSDQHVPETPHVRGSTRQVLVIGATEEATLELRDADGQTVATATADEFGSFAFRDVGPDGGYTVVEDPEGESTTLAEDIAVFPVAYEPPQELYDGQTLEPTDDGEIDYIEMRDGTDLACQVQIPGSGDPPYPTLILYDGYAPSVSASIPDEVSLLGYAVVAVNKRGTQCSGGKYDFWERLQWLDGYDIVETVAAQDWSDGVGLIGASYSGYSQFYAAAPQPPSLDAIAPGVPVGDYYRDVGRPGGIRNSRFASGWAQSRDSDNAPFPEGGRGDVEDRIEEDDLCYFNQLLGGQNVSIYDRLLENEFDTDFYQERAAWNFVEDIEVPTLLMTAWQDEQVGSRATRLLERFDGDHPVHFIGINGDHGAMMAYILDIIDFFTLYLEGEAPAGFDGTYEEALAAYQAEPYRIYWEKDQDLTTRAVSEYAEWPPGETWDLYFQPDGGLGPEPPETAASAGYQYVAPSEEEQLLDRDGDGRLVWEQAPEEQSATFVTDPLPADHVLVGSGLVELWVETTAEDTDIQVDLMEVRPDGQEMYVQSGWLRASHRQEKDQLSRPRRPWHTHRPGDVESLGDGYEQMRVEVHPFGHVFRRGSRLKVAVTNPGGTRDLWAFDVNDEAETNTIALSPERPSKVELPLVPGDSAPVTGRPDCGEVRNQPCRESRSGPLELPEIDGVVPTDLDGDGLYEDLTGSGDLGILDVQVLFRNLDSPAVQEYAWAFDFSDTGGEEVTIFDVQALFSRVLTE